MSDKSSAPSTHGASPHVAPGESRAASARAPSTHNAGSPPAAPIQSAPDAALFPASGKANAFGTAVAAMKKAAAAPVPKLKGDAEATVKLEIPMTDEKSKTDTSTDEPAKGGSAEAIAKLQAETGAQQKRTVSHALGEITWLMTQSPAHKHLLLSDLEWFVMPAILLEQFRIYYAPVPGKAGAEGATQPAGCAIWARVSDEVEARLKEAGSNARLKLQDWRSGNKPYLIEIIAPFGGADEMRADWERVIVKGA